jgi:hypothetical protein
VTIDADLDLGPLGRAPYHLGVTTCALAAGTACLGELFGVSWTAAATVPGRPLATPRGTVDWSCRRVHSLGTGLQLEVLEGSPGSTWATLAVAQLHHLAYWSDDLGADVAALIAAGWALEVTFADGPGPSGFAYLSKAGSTRIELVDRSGRNAYLMR